jgi:hypothetical protein
MAESSANSTAEKRQSQANTAYPAAARDEEACELTGIPLAKFDLPDVEIPIAFRELAETVAALARAQLGATDATAEAVVAIAARRSSDAEISEPLKEDPGELTDDDFPDDDTDCAGDDGSDAQASEEVPASDGNLASAAANATAYSLKIIEAACVNASAMVAFANDLLRAKSLSQIVELSTSHAARQIETVAEQTKQIAEVTQIINRKRSSGGHEPENGPEGAKSNE